MCDECSVRPMHGRGILVVFLAVSLNLYRKATAEPA